MIPGAIITSFFFVYGITTGIAPLLRFNEIKNTNAQYNYDSPSVESIAMHWICILMFIFFGVSMILYGSSLVKIPTFYKRRGPFFVLIIVSGVLAGIFWIVYGCVTGLSANYKALNNVVNLDNVNEFVKNTKDLSINLEIVGKQYCKERVCHYRSSSSSSRRKKSCTYKNVLKKTETHKYKVVTTDNSGDIKIPEGIKSIHLKALVDVSNSASVIDEKRSLEASLKSKLQPTCSNGYSTAEGTFSVDVQTDYLMTAGGLVPKVLDKSKAGLLGTFWAPLAYVYDFASYCPVVNFDVKKYGTDIGSKIY